MNTPLKLEMICPHCKKTISIEEPLMQFEEAMRKKLEEELQENSLNLKKKEKTIEDLKTRLDDMRKRIDASSTSQQLSGAILQQSLEQTLKQTHPTDIFLANKVGKSGADLFQEVKTSEGQSLGSIIYEIKNTQSFVAGWTDKLKKDNANSKSELMIIVTKAMPKEITGKFGLLDGIWVCQIDFIQELTIALRYALIKMKSIVVAEKHEKSKAEILYRYLNSEQSKYIWDAILNGYKKIQDSYYDERVRVERLWAERDKTLQHMLSLTLDFQSHISQISLTTPDIKLLTAGKKS